MIKRFLKSGVIQICILFLLLLLLLSEIPSAYEIWLADATIEQTDPDGPLQIIFQGANLLRVNAFYLDGKRLDNSTVYKETYERCVVEADKSYFANESHWYKLEVGFCKWGIINLKSTPVWVEWIDAE